MNILFLNAYFYPEKIAFTHLEEDIIKEIIGGGHTITVICSVPTRGIDDETARKYKSIKDELLYDGRVRVKRFWAPREGRNPIVRAFRYFWCNFREYTIAKKYKNTDAVFAVSTPPTQGYLAGRVARKLGVPFVYNLQDIFPDSLVTSGLTSEGSLLWKIGRLLENATYRLADKIIVVSESFKKNILAKGVAEDKIELVSNWIDTDAVAPVPRADNAIFEEFGIPRDKFIVVYAGNFGALQGADVVLRAAQKLKDNEAVHFAIFGGGSEFNAAVKYVSDNELCNVTINPLLPLERVSEVYSLGDAAVITCKKGVGNSGMPSKTWSIMACNTPIIASFDEDSELAQILTDSGAGVATEPENADALVEAIAKQMQKTEPCASREYVMENASRERCAPKYAAALGIVEVKQKINT